jgi:hypothetical protein
MINKITMLNANSKQFRSNLLASIDEDGKALVAEYQDNFQNWDRVGEFYSDLAGEEACEYAFDLSNNPRMQSERKLVQGCSRSLSVGDCVGVTEVSDDGFESYSMYICLNQGWEQVL